MGITPELSTSASLFKSLFVYLVYFVVQNQASNVGNAL
jgi:hypothetical protein